MILGTFENAHSGTLVNIGISARYEGPLSLSDRSRRLEGAREVRGFDVLRRWTVESGAGD
jgi:hypothetical protein